MSKTRLARPGNGRSGACTKRRTCKRTEHIADLLRDRRIPLPTQLLRIRRDSWCTGRTVPVCRGLGDHPGPRRTRPYAHEPRAWESRSPVRRDTRSSISEAATPGRVRSLLHLSSPLPRNARLHARARTRYEHAHAPRALTYARAPPIRSSTAGLWRTSLVPSDRSRPKCATLSRTCSGFEVTVQEPRRFSA